ncbi:hypothetical protein [Nocardia tenerifensis]|uniref:hypothetical protein n=1 Tax=Nocardia tenerifensis TaxID=228006 RepID=UPI0002EAEED6|nr:hypothetical protein [Nocardia tenerifensis]
MPAVRGGLDVLAPDVVLMSDGGGPPYASAWTASWRAGGEEGRVFVDRLGPVARRGSGHHTAEPTPFL